MAGRLQFRNRSSPGGDTFEPGNPRQWVLCHYQPYWNKKPGQFARSENFKLYRDGRFFQVPLDLREAHNLASGASGPQGEQMRARLQTLLDQSPPAATVIGNRETKDRPVYPDWKNLVDPND